MEITHHMLITAIEYADGLAIDDIFAALRRRFKRLYPDEEILFISLPRNDWSERERILRQILEIEKRARGTDCHASVRTGSQ